MDKLVEAGQRVNHRMSFLRVWERNLTDAERERLGGDAGASFTSCRGTIGMWLKLRGVSQPRAIIELARMTDQLSEADYQWLDQEISKIELLLPAFQRGVPRPRGADGDVDEQINRARELHRLVLVEGQGVRRLYWRGDRVEPGWGRHSTTWELLRQLAVTRLKGGRVAWDTLTNCSSFRAMVNRRHRLKKLLPDDLDALIGIGGSEGPYGLGLEREQVKVIELAPGQCLLED